MNIVFLDFDGVLNDRAWLCRMQEQNTIDELSPPHVELLNKLLTKTEAEVVISSTWRILHKPGELQSFLNKAGFTGRIHRRAPVTPGGGGRRGPQIQQWIDAQEFDGSFIILDDDSDMDHLLPYLVQTDTEIGLTASDVDRAVDLMKSRPTPLAH